MDTCKGVGSIYRGKLYLFICSSLLSYHRAETSIQVNYSSFYNKLTFYSTQSNHSCTSSVIVSSHLTSSIIVSSRLTSSVIVSSCAVVSIISITFCNVICNTG